MKKLFLASALALASLASQGTETVALNSGWSSSGASSGTTNAYPVNLFSQYSACQVLLTDHELADLMPKKTSASSEYKVIESVTFKCATTEEGLYADVTGELNVTVYAENTESLNFVNDTYFSTDNAVKGTLTYDGSQIIDGEPMEVTVTFESPVKYEGKGLVLTFYCENNLEYEYIDYGMHYYNGYYSYNPRNPNGGYRTVSHVSETAMPSLTGAFSSGSASEIPYLWFEVSTEVEENGPTTITGEATTIGIGVKEEQEYGENGGSPGPHTLSYENAVSQAIYPRTVLGDLFVNDGSSVTKANITALTSYIIMQGCYGEPEVTADVYVMNSTENAFPVNSNNKEQWIEVDYSNAIHGHAEFDTSSDGWDVFSSWAEGEIPVKITLDEPFEYEGNSIVITWVTTSVDPSVFEYNIASYYGFKGADNNVSGVKTDVTTVSGDLVGGGKYLPYLDVDYFPVTYSGGEVTPMINVSEPVLAAVATADGAGNNITATFTIKDEANVGKYEVSVGTAKVGTFEGTEFTINYLQPIEKDVMVYVAPVGSDAALEGSAAIAAADIAALFAAPTAEAVEGKQAMNASVDYNAKNMTVNAAAQLHVNTIAPVANISFTGTGAELLYGSDNSYSDLIPEAATGYETARNLGNTEGYVAFVKKNAFTVPVKYGVPLYEEYTGNGNVTVAPTVEFPIAKVKAGGYSLTADVEFEVPYSNKISQQLGNVAVKFTVSEENVKTTSSYPTRMEVGEDDVNFIMYATEGHVIKYAICEYGDEAGELTEGGNAIEVVALESLKGKRIDYANVNEEGVADNEGHRYFGEDGKIFTDIIEVSAPELSLIAVTDNDGNKAIDINAKFTFNDPKSGNLHYIEVNGGDSHSLTGLGTEFEIHFLQYSDEDVHVTIKQSGTTPSMGWATIKAEDIKALFDVEEPAVELTAQDFHGFYDAVIPEAKTMDLTLAGQYTVTAAVPAVDVVFEETGAQSFTASHPTFGEIFSGLFTENVEEGTHTIVFAQTITEAVPVQYGWHNVEQAEVPSTIELTPTVVYPIAQVENYALSQYKDWSVAYVDELSFIFNSVSLDVDLENIDEEKVTREHAEEVVVKADLQNLVIYAPKGHFVEVKIDEAASTLSYKAPAKTEGYTNEGNIAVIPLENIKGKTLSFNTVNEETEEVTPGEYQYTADDNGVSAIYSIEADSFNADVEYYNLQGVRVRGNLAPGLYIRRQGSSTVKVQVR